MLSDTSLMAGVLLVLVVLVALVAVILKKMIAQGADVHGASPMPHLVRENSVYSLTFEFRGHRFTLMTQGRNEVDARLNLWTTLERRRQNRDAFTVESLNGPASLEEMMSYNSAIAGHLRANGSVFVTLYDMMWNTPLTTTKFAAFLYRAPEAQVPSPALSPAQLLRAREFLARASIPVYDLRNAGHEDSRQSVRILRQRHRDASPIASPVPRRGQIPHVGAPASGGSSHVYRPSSRASPPRGASPQNLPAQ